MRADLSNMSTDSPQPTAEKRRYRYPGLFLTQCIGLFSIPMGLAFIGFGIYLHKKGAWIGIPLGSLVTWFSIYTAKASFKENRPLTTDEAGVTALAWG